MNQELRTALLNINMALGRLKDDEPDLKFIETCLSIAKYNIEPPLK